MNKTFIQGREYRFTKEQYIKAYEEIGKTQEIDEFTKMMIEMSLETWVVIIDGKQFTARGNGAVETIQVESDLDLDVRAGWCVEVTTKETAKVVEFPVVNFEKDVEPESVEIQEETKEQEEQKERKFIKGKKYKFSKEKCLKDPAMTVIEAIDPEAFILGVNTWMEALDNQEFTAEKLLFKGDSVELESIGKKLHIDWCVEA